MAPTLNALPREALHGADAGKMFGVLVVRTPDGALGVLRAFSGRLAFEWDVAGFVPPVFERESRAKLDAASEATVRGLTARVNAAPRGTPAEQRRHRALVRLRRVVSRASTRQIFESYVFTNALGATRTVASMFAPGSPPSGAGDCAAPKLLVFALRHQLVPLALAEGWWGEAPKDGAFHQGDFAPPCEKCRRVLPFLLEGLG